MSRRRIAGLALVAVASALALAACQRRTQLVAVGSDSTGVASDSFSIRVRQMQQLWDEPAAGIDGAKLSAELLREDLAAHPDQPWPSRTRALLDSLDLGAEITADARVVVVNFFSRAHPEGGSWPWLFWPVAKGGAGARALSGQGLQLLQVASRPRSGDVRSVAVLFGRRAATGQTPMLMVWNDLVKPAAEPAQILGPDSLGGAGSASFESGTDSTIALVSRTYRGVPRFEECATCPHVYTVRRFVWDGPQFHKTEEHSIPSPYSSFVQFVSALVAQDLDREFRYVSDPTVVDAAKRYELDMVARGAWRVAPATDESADRMTFFRGQTEAYQVSFTPRGDDWIITSIVPTQRTVE